MFSGMPSMYNMCFDHEFLSKLGLFINPVCLKVQIILLHKNPVTYKIFLVDSEFIASLAIHLYTRVFIDIRLQCDRFYSEHDGHHSDQHGWTLLPSRVL